MRSWYVYLFAELLAFAFMGFSAKCRSKQGLFLISALPLFFILAFRYEVGTDYWVYSNAYTAVSGYGFFKEVPAGYVSWLGTGFIVLCKVINLIFGSDYIWYHVVMAALAIGALYAAIYKGSVIPVLSLFIFICDGYYYVLFNQTRQLLAAIIVLASTRYIMKKKLTPFVFTVIIASLIHQSALLFMPAYFLAKMKMNIPRLIAIIALAFVAIKFWGIVEAFVATTKYAHYLAPQHNYAAPDTTLMRFVYRSFFWAFCFFFRIRTVEKFPHTRGLFVLLAGSIALQILSMHSYIFARVVIYYYIPILFLLPYVLKSLPCNWKVIFTFGICSALTVGHAVYFVQKADGLLAPIYQTIFSR